MQYWKGKHSTSQDTVGIGNCDDINGCVYCAAEQELIAIVSALANSTGSPNYY